MRNELDVVIRNKNSSKQTCSDIALFHEKNTLIDGVMSVKAEQPFSDVKKKGYE